MSIIAKNPIMPGFYPDPSICAVDGDYYLVCSTFAYFPGLPILHSKDLAHWEQVGNVMSRESQLPLKGCGHSEGLFAPTIRYHDGTFYVICTNVSGGGNYVVTAPNIEGPWSEPYYIEGADGIDPSLFFDEDGTCYYMGTHPNPKGCQYNGDWYVWVQELDISNMKLVGEKHDVWNGSMKNVIWPEGPHLYKKDGYYYILHAEGGTGPDHCISICRSKEVFGPYENCSRNPLITHRHLGKEYPIRYVGHGDMIQTPKGEWYMVMLAVRPTEGYTTMGRETFLAKVDWEDGWPVVNKGVGLLTEEVEIDLPCWEPESGGKNVLPGINRIYDFGSKKELGDEFLMLRNPAKDMYRFTKEGLVIKAQPETLKEKASPSYIAIRQQHHRFLAYVKADISDLEEKDVAGIVLMQDNNYNIRIEAGKQQIKAILCEDGKDTVLQEISSKEETLELYIQVDGLQAVMGVFNEVVKSVLAEVSVASLSTEKAGGFVGCTIGMYASSNKEAAGGEVTFTKFSYQSLQGE